MLPTVAEINGRKYMVYEEPTVDLVTGMYRGFFRWEDDISIMEIYPDDLPEIYTLWKIESSWSCDVDGFRVSKYGRTWACTCGAGRTCRHTEIGQTRWRAADAGNGPGCAESSLSDS